MRPYIINSPQVICEDVSGETVIINLETGSYYNLNQEAAKLWARLIGGADLDALKGSAQPQTKESGELIEAFFAKLIGEGLIKKTDAALVPIDGQIALDATDLVLEIYTDMQDLLGLDPIHEVEPEAGWPLQKS